MSKWSVSFPIESQRDAYYFAIMLSNEGYELDYKADKWAEKNGEDAVYNELKRQAKMYYNFAKTVGKHVPIKGPIP